MKKQICLLLTTVSCLSLHCANADQVCTTPCEETCCPSWGPLEVDLSLGLDDFRGIPDGSWGNSFGALTALNFSLPLPLSFVTQIAGSYGIYDWAGRASTPFKNSKTFQQQGFITIAASWQTPCDSGFNAGVAYDWMFNKNFGLFAVNPYLDQIRGQLGYLFNNRNEIGAWGAYGIRNAHKESQNIPLRFRGISQVNLFWCHYFKYNGYAMIWAGSPYRRGLLYKSGRPGRFTLGAQFSAPLTRHLNLECHGAYMSPRGGRGVTPSKNYGMDLYFGLTYAFGECCSPKSPYMTLANNSNFMVDTNQNF